MRLIRCRFPRSGMLEKGTFTLCSSKGNKERIGRLVEMHSNDRTDIDIARTGDIVAIGGLKVRTELFVTARHLSFLVLTCTRTVAADAAAAEILKACLSCFRWLRFITMRR